MSAPSALRALASPSRVEILYRLQECGAPMTVDQVAAAVGLHPNTAREHLDRLVATQFVSRRPEVRTTRGRPRVLYRWAPRPAAASLDARFREQLLAVLLAAHERSAARRAVVVGAGTTPSSERSTSPGAAPAVTAAARQLVALEMHLDDLGFEPEMDAAGSRVDLRQCPFADLARERTAMVCSVHLDLTRGVLEHEGGPVTAERLEPFVGPQHCVLHLGRTPGPTPVPGADEPLR